ncbi:ribosomal biogenesis factor-like [Pagrus major]|uniref:ribosomal biogenesis factor-like n=1 Tax=Pagrus major TaxID=143350 RepID=UPI003CC83AD4
MRISTQANSSSNKVCLWLLSAGGIRVTWNNLNIVFFREQRAGNMGKNKQKGKKQKNVFQVANKHLKPKNKAKPVTTTLKHINAVKNEKVENLNQIFTEVQRDVKSVSKSVAPEPKKRTQVVREPPKESVNVDNAAQLFSQL